MIMCEMALFYRSSETRQHTMSTHIRLTASSSASYSASQLCVADAKRGSNTARPPARRGLPRAARVSRLLRGATRSRKRGAHDALAAGRSGARPFAGKKAHRQHCDWAQAVVAAQRIKKV